MEVLFQLLKAALWGTPPPTELITKEIFQELKSHALLALPASILSSLHMSDDLRKSWQTAIYQQISFQANYRYAQRNLMLGVPYVILKGTSAGKYYPNPEYRAMGDIDVMTMHEDYETACNELLLNGYTENTSSAEKDFGRHRGFFKNGIEVEVHSFFTLRNDPAQAEYLDNLIIENINSTHVLPDLINGLVLLAHIDQHMEGGIGLRHIIDWMMFVNECLSDRNDNWDIFQKMASKVGLEKLAVISTRMSEIYLGLPAHNWCKDADTDVCVRLMEYVISSGNFGIKRNDETSNGANLLTYARNPIATFRLLQERGSFNWKATRKHKILLPFAWIYQSIRYIFKGLSRKQAPKLLKKEYEIAKDRIVLLDELGVKQTSKGLAVYENGRYKKEYKRP